MNKDVKNYVSSLDRRSFTNNTQRVLYRLLTAGGDGWLTLAQLRTPSAGSRVRDLRKAEFGRISVEAVSADQRGRNNGQRSHYYRVASGVTLSQLRTVFGE